MLLPNLYGSIVSGICAGITGGVGLTPGVNVGENHVIFESGNRHDGKYIAGKNIANPTAILLSTVMLLRNLNLPIFADRLAYGINSALQYSEIRTMDLGGNHSLSDYIDEVIKFAK